jgi:FkbM family methyltransferase
MIQRLLPARVRAAFRSLSRLWKKDRHLLWRTLRCVRGRSLVEVFACFEDEGGTGIATYRIWLKSRIQPLILRRGSSDFAVFRQVILEDQYGLEEIRQPQYIVDAGANIGLSSVVFLEKFPQCRLLAIEPDPQNYAIAQKNLEIYGERCRLLPVALWSEAGSLTVQRGIFRDGLDWSCQTVAASEHTGTVVDARTMRSLLDEVGFPRIDFLKVDIEGAELQVFGEGDRSFLSQTGVCATECHGPHCREVYIKAIESYGFAWRHAGELTIAWRSPTAELDSPDTLFAKNSLPLTLS